MVAEDAKTQRWTSIVNDWYKKKILLYMIDEGNIHYNQK